MIFLPNCTKRARCGVPYGVLYYLFSPLFLRKSVCFVLFLPFLTSHELWYGLSLVDSRVLLCSVAFCLFVRYTVQD